MPFCRLAVFQKKRKVRRSRLLSTGSASRSGATERERSTTTSAGSAARAGIEAAVTVITVRTVAVHCSAACLRCETNPVTHAAAFAIQRGCPAPVGPTRARSTSARSTLGSLLTSSFAATLAFSGSARIAVNGDGVATTTTVRKFLTVAGCGSKSARRPSPTRQLPHIPRWPESSRRPAAAS